MGAVIYWIVGIFLTFLALFALRSRPSLPSRKHREETEEFDTDSFQSSSAYTEDATSSEGETPEWVDLMIFPMDHQRLHPIGAQFVTRKTMTDKRQEVFDRLDEANIPYRTDIAEESVMQAEKLQVPIEDVERAREVLKDIKLNVELW